MSALSGMGVAFYTSLVGAGCSILLTILRTIFSPQASRERLETRLELWLDMEIAPTLSTDAVKDDAELISQMIDALNEASESFTASTKTAAVALVRAIGDQKDHFQEFDKSLDKFNSGVHDFSEVDYNLRGSVERMDLAVRDLSAAMREINRRLGGKQQ